ncbi:uncharacterized protein LOC135204984 [Macrobrachium nipponense]|uniref:uncharacterized protein LOC135204984 n=1 Tax=Macrobrachium nipponense TaxID=159736 RepID=UPI0030C8C5C2
MFKNGGHEMRQKVAKDKEEAKKRWEESQLMKDRDRFREKNKAVKKVVAQAKAKSYDDVYNKLGTKEGLKKMIKLSKAKNKSTKDITHIKQIKDQDGVVLRKKEDIVKRWKEYFEHLLNEENNKLIREVLNTLKKMKNGKATGPDMIPVEAWKALGDEGVDILYDLMIKILEQEKIPNEWRENILILIFKGKADVQECGNYRGTKLMSRTLKILERMIDARLREEVRIESGEDLEMKLERWRQALEVRGMRISRSKTEYMCTTAEGDDRESIQLGGEQIELVLI